MVGKKQSSRSNKSKKAATTKKPRPVRKQAKPKSSVKSSKKMKSSKPKANSTKPKVNYSKPKANSTKRTAVKKSAGKPAQKKPAQKSAAKKSLPKPKALKSRKQKPAAAKQKISKSKSPKKQSKKQIAGKRPTAHAKKEDNMFAEQEKLLSELALEMPVPPSPKNTDNADNFQKPVLSGSSFGSHAVSSSKSSQKQNPSFIKWLLFSNKQTTAQSHNPTKDELDVLEKTLVDKNPSLKKSELSSLNVKSEMPNSVKNEKLAAQAPVKKAETPKKDTKEVKEIPKEIPLANIPKKSTENQGFIKWIFSSKKKPASSPVSSMKDELDMLEKSMLDDNIKPKKFEAITTEKIEMPKPVKTEKRISQAKVSKTEDKKDTQDKKESKGTKEVKEIPKEIPLANIPKKSTENQGFIKWIFSSKKKPASSPVSSMKDELDMLEKSIVDDDIIANNINTKKPEAKIQKKTIKKHLQQFDMAKLEKEIKTQKIPFPESLEFPEPPESVDDIEPKKHFDLFSFLKKNDKTVSKSVKAPVQTKPVVKDKPLAKIISTSSSEVLKQQKKSDFFKWIFSSKKKPASSPISSMKDELDMLEKSMLDDNIKPKKLEAITTEKIEMPKIPSLPAEKSEVPKELPKHILPKEKRPKVDLFAIFKKETENTLKKEAVKEKQPVKLEHEKHLEKVKKLHETFVEKRIALSQSIFELEKKKKQIESEIKEDEKHLRILDTQKRDKLQQIDERHRQLAKKEIELADKDKLLEEKHNEHKDIHKTVQKKKEEHSLLEKQARDYEKHIGKLDAQLKNLYSARDALKLDNDSLKKNLGEKEKQLNEKQSVISNKEKQLNEAESVLSKKEKQLSDAEAELQKNKKIHLDMHELLNKKKVEVEMKAKLMDDFESKRNTLQSEISKLRIEKEKLDIEILETNKFITDKESEKKQVKDSLESTMKEKFSLEESIKSSRKELDQLAKDINSKKANLEKKNKELSKVQQKIDSKKTDAETKNILSMLDNLLGKLPDNVIDEFSKSDDFNKYEKVMGKLGLK